MKSFDHEKAKKNINILLENDIKYFKKLHRKFEIEFAKNINVDKIRDSIETMREDDKMVALELLYRGIRYNNDIFEKIISEIDASYDDISTDDSFDMIAYKISVTESIRDNSINEQPTSINQPKKFLSSITGEQLNLFQNVINTDEEQKFINDYINSYQEQEYELDDIYSLILTKAVLKSNTALVDYILSKDRGNILVNVDKNGDSAIYNTLMFNDKNILKLVGNYIERNTEKFKKTELATEMLDCMANVISHSENIKTYIDCYLAPLYTEDSITKLINIVGEDSIYDITY